VTGNGEAFWRIIVTVAVLLTSGENSNCHDYPHVLDRARRRVSHDGLPSCVGAGCGAGAPHCRHAGEHGPGTRGRAAVESIARQPEAAGDIRSALLLALALIESLVIYCLLTFFLLMGKLPSIMEYLQAKAGGR